MIRTDGLGILVGLTLSRGARILSVVGKLIREPMCGNSIGVNDRSTTTSNHSPNTALSIENSELERSASGSVELLDVGFFLGQVTTEWSRPDLQDAR